MANSTQKNDLASLSMTWSERVKTIRAMAKNDDTDRTDYATVSAPPTDIDLTVPADEDLFADTVPDQLSVQDLFAGNPDFFNSLQTPPSACPPLAQPSVMSEPVAIQSGSRRPSSLLPKVIAACLAVVLVCLLIFGGLYGWLSVGVVSSPEQAATPKAEAANPEVSLASDAPASLKIADDYYREGEYLRAAAVYRRLFDNLSDSTEHDLFKDYLQLNIALCVKDRAVYESSKMLKKVAYSKSPIVRILANYHLSLLDMQHHQFLSARARAYQAAGLVDLAEFDKEWSRRMKRDCYFLGAQAVTRKVLALCDADKDLPSALWPDFTTETHPLMEMSESQIQEVLKTGIQQLNKSLLEPKIINEHKDGLTSWTVISNNASIKELITRFAAASGYDVRWDIDMKTTDTRNRSVSLYLPGVDSHQLLTIAAGSAGLLAYSDDKGIITICSPMDYLYASDQISLLNTNAVACWQTYQFAFLNDEYLPNVHFAMGLLKAREGLISEALSEFKIIPGRYPHSNLGPGALTRTAGLKSSLHDDQGAYDDLKEAVEQYSSQENIEQTYLALGAAAVRIGRDEEAAKLYSKVYYLNHSFDSQAAAAFEAGRIFYQTQNYKDAEQWLTRYVTMKQDSDHQQFYQALLLLGKTWQALGNYKSSCEALHGALRGRLSQQDYVQTVTALVEGYLKQDHFVDAYEVLNETDSRQLSQADSIQILLLKSQVLREMGLTNKAVTLLTEREEYIIDDSQKGLIRYELSECYREQGRPELAYKKLAAILEQAETGPFAHKTALKLADVCLQLGMDDQVLHVGSELLNLNPDPDIQDQARALLAAVYQKQEKYDLAALVLMGQLQ